MRTSAVTGLAVGLLSAIALPATVLAQPDPPPPPPQAYDAPAHLDVPAAPGQAAPDAPPADLAPQPAPPPPPQGAPPGKPAQNLDLTKGVGGLGGSLAGNVAGAVVAGPVGAVAGGFVGNWLGQTSVTFWRHLTGGSSKGGHEGSTEAPH